MDRKSSKVFRSFAEAIAEMKKIIIFNINIVGTGAKLVYFSIYVERADMHGIGSLPSPERILRCLILVVNDNVFSGPWQCLSSVVCILGPAADAQDSHHTGNLWRQRPFLIYWHPVLQLLFGPCHTWSIKLWGCLFSVDWSRRNLVFSSFLKKDHNHIGDFEVLFRRHAILAQLDAKYFWLGFSVFIILVFLFGFLLACLLVFFVCKTSSLHK